MKKQLHSVSVETLDDGDICISQCTHPDDDFKIFLHPDQVPLLVQWLDEARGELAKRCSAKLHFNNPDDKPSPDEEPL